MLLRPSGSDIRRRDSAAHHDSGLKGNYRIQSNNIDNRKVVHGDQ